MEHDEGGEKKAEDEKGRKQPVQHHDLSSIRSRRLVSVVDGNG
jgi:hypothetical protein